MEKENPEIRVELILDGKRAKEHFAALEENRAQIEHDIGSPLVWHNPEGKNMCRIYIRNSADFRKPELWPEQHQWLKDNLETFYKVFAPLVKNLD